jgi:transcription elongation factor GreA
MERFPITKAGYDRMEEELKDLKGVQRPYIIGQIAEARAHGDLKENAEYKAAKDRQSYIEGRIQDLEARVSLAEIIDVASLNGTQVKFGATVTLEDLETEKKKTYRIVGEYEADLDKGLIAYTSPVARAIMGKNKGDVVEVTTPKGLVEYEISDVEFK